MRESRPEEQQQQESSSSQDSTLPTPLIRTLYIGHFLARWDARLYHNSLGIFSFYHVRSCWLALYCVYWYVIVCKFETFSLYFLN